MSNNAATQQPPSPFAPPARFGQRFTTWVIIVGVLIGANGCMSVEHLIDRGQKLQMYGGVKSSVAYIEDEGAPWLGTFVRVLDLPITAVFDTVLLPISAPVELIRG